MPSDAPDLSPARLEKLLATVSLPLDNRGRTSREKSEAIETLIALYATLSSRVIELEAALRAIAAHGSHHGGYCGCHQATFINIARTALEPSHD